MSNTRSGIINGDCVKVMSTMPRQSVDFILTDPPYLVSYKDRSGRTVKNDDNAAWLEPAFREMYRLLKPDSLAVSFYGWGTVDLFFAAWKKAGFRPVGHIVFAKPYSSKERFLQYRHESAYLLAKGRPSIPAAPLPDVLEWNYSGNKLHPTQKAVSNLKPLIETFSKPDAVVLDPFAGSGSTCVAALRLGRKYIGIELDEDHCGTARKRLGIAPQPSAKVSGQKPLSVRQRWTKAMRILVGKPY